MTTDLEALRERLEKADGPDREIDRDLWEALTGECTHRNTRYVYLDNGERELECADCGRDTYGADKWSGLTRSLDAALSLAERARPGSDIDLEIRETMMDGKVLRPTDVTIFGRAFSDEPNTHAHADTPALALCLAIVKAKIAEENNAS